MKNAFKITAKIDGQSWSNRATVLTAPNEEQALVKAAEILRLKPEHVVTVERVKVYATCEKLQVDNYPYGRLQCTAFFSVESNKTGMRTVFQTINPKTGRLNAPKKSTYSAALLPMQYENGRVEYCGHLDFNGAEQFNVGLQFMFDFYELFTPEEIVNVARRALVMSKAEAQALVVYCGANWEDLKPLLEPAIKTLVEITNTGRNLWYEAALDVDAIEATKKPDYNPFKVTQYTV